MKSQAFVAFLALAALPLASAESLLVDTDKESYNYGDYLTITITVQKITDDSATMRIIGPDGVRSAAIAIQIKDTTTSITTPNSFDPSIFKEGPYQIEVEYGGAKSSAEFEIVNAGNKYLPIGSNVIVSQWSSGGISDYSLLKFLSDNKIISFSNIADTVKIPSWYKENGNWWLDKQITDVEFLNGLQYLIDAKIIS